MLYNLFDTYVLLCVSFRVVVVTFLVFLVVCLCVKWFRCCLVLDPLVNDRFATCFALYLCTGLFGCLLNHMLLLILLLLLFLFLLAVISIY